MDVVTYKVGKFIDSKSHPMRGISCHEKSYNYVNLISKCITIYALRNLFNLTNPKQFNWGTCLASYTKVKNSSCQLENVIAWKKKGKKKLTKQKMIENNRKLYFFISVLKLALPNKYYILLFNKFFFLFTNNYSMLP